MNYEELLKRGPYELGAEEKKKIYADMLSELTDSHRNRCLIYDRCCSALGDVSGSQRREEEIPMVPVSMFKEMELRSVPTGAVFKTVTSSGTTGQKTSKIVLDERTAAWQQQTLQRIMADFIGEKRIPMLIIDAPNVLRDRALFSARGAGILGFSIFGSKRCYALKEDMSLDLETVEAFLEKAGDGPVLVFGFTYMVWKYFYEPLKRSGHRLHLEHGSLIHGGGWKKLAKEAVSAEKFRDGLREVCGILDVRNYYGMAEQTGCIYMECECGHLHVSSYSDVLIRNMEDFSCCKNGTEGVIQVLTPMAWSYPGHSVLTEDKGMIVGEDDCPCGRKGKYIKITGRIPKAEIRGCSDTFETGKELRGENEAVTLLAGEMEITSVPKSRLRRPPWSFYRHSQSGSGNFRECCPERKCVLSDSGSGVPTSKAIKSGMKTVVSGLGWDKHFILRRRMFRFCLYTRWRLDCWQEIPAGCGCRREETRKAKRSVS